MVGGSSNGRNLPRRLRNVAGTLRVSRKPITFTTPNRDGIEMETGRKLGNEQIGRKTHEPPANSMNKSSQLRKAVNKHSERKAIETQLTIRCGMDILGTDPWSWTWTQISGSLFLVEPGQQANRELGNKAPDWPVALAHTNNVSYGHATSSKPNRHLANSKAAASGNGREWLAAQAREDSNSGTGRRAMMQVPPVRRVHGAFRDPLSGCH